jgi:hypothetical protein
MMERMLRMEDGGADRRGCAKFGKFGHFLPFRASRVLPSGLHVLPGCH